MLVAQTSRLIIRHFNHQDTDFIINLLNQPSFINNIGDKQVRNHSDAINYLNSGPIASYQTYGFGLNMVQLKHDNTPIGMCGLLKRPELAHPDLGYALLPEHWRKGYIEEASHAVLADAAKQHKVDNILAVTKPDNIASNALLSKLGFTVIGHKSLYGSDNKLYQKQL
ncbi:GNAT family N-acetyltransferase [Thalassotalea sp. Y01]|uniref:GNAT family N-acetyltransferase n=1 Tax=Thalassotalea sp. Y01 TaxID=2729613 RepID=UPI00145F589E|nr:GNAT family N-acetyltransferase [Thalassotalea sp. Y01]NMP16316.1 GNAT family N-acetyltransferase [Thalassotalea sp. Y01]